MLIETSLLFKTMLILSSQIGIVFGTAYYFIKSARKAYENNTKFFGLSFRGATNFNKELDLVPYIESPTSYPVEMFKHIEEHFDEKTKKLVPERMITKLANSREEALKLMGDGFKYKEGGNKIVAAYVIWLISLFATCFYASFGISVSTGLIIFTFQSLTFGPMLGWVMLEMDENDGLKAMKIVLLATLLTGYLGYSGLYSFSENVGLQVFLFISLLGLIVFSFIRTIFSFSRKTKRIQAIFGAFIFTLYLLVDFNLVKSRQDGGANNWDSAFELAFMIYLDMINLLLKILEAMSNS